MKRKTSEPLEEKEKWSKRRQKTIFFKTPDKLPRPHKRNAGEKLENFEHEPKKMKLEQLDTKLNISKFTPPKWGAEYFMKNKDIKITNTCPIDNIYIYFI